VGGTATKKALAEQGRLGLRDDKGIKDADGFAKNPIQWVNDNIVPALEKDGVDLSSEVAIAQAVQKFSSNRLARDFIQRAITQREVYMRLSGMMQSSVGLEGASEVDARDPFSAFKGFKDSMSNLAAAVLPAEAIAAGLNTVADGINALQGAWRDGDLGARLAIGGGAAAGAFGMWKVGTAIWGLMTAGTNLNLAAASLEAAAISLGGAGVSDNLPGKKGNKSGWLGWLGAMAGTLGTVVGTGIIQSGSSRDMTDEEKAKVLADGERDWSVIQERRRMEAEARAAAQARYDANEAKTTEGFNTFHGIVGDAQQTGQDVKDALSVTAKPTVDKTDLQATLNLVNQIKASLSGLGASISAAHSQAQREMNRNFSDHGVAP